MLKKEKKGELATFSKIMMVMVKTNYRGPSLVFVKDPNAARNQKAKDVHYEK